MTEMKDRPEEWQPGYLLWSFAIYVSTVLATLLAPLIVSRLFGMPLNLDMILFLLGLALVTVAAWMPGLLGMFLISLTQIPLRYHGLIGGLVFAALSGLMGRFSRAAMAYGFLFGLVSLGGTAGVLALRRHVVLGREARYA